MSSAAAAQPVPLRPYRQMHQPGLHEVEVATMLDTLAAADRELADALDSIVSSRARVSRATVSVLERVLATLRPAADMKAQLARIDRRVLAAAIRLRRDRCDALRDSDGGDVRAER